MGLILRLPTYHETSAKEETPQCGGRKQSESDDQRNECGDAGTDEAVHILYEHCLPLVAVNELAHVKWPSGMGQVRLQLR